MHRAPLSSPPHTEPVNYTNFPRHFLSFPQIINATLVHTFYLQYRRDLQNIMKEMHLPYDIEILTKIRHEAFRKNLDMQRRGVPMRVPIIQRTVRSSQKTQIVHLAQSAATATNSFQPPAPGMHQLQPMLQMQSATTTMETVCATNGADMQMQIPTVTSTMMSSSVPPNENFYQVYATNGQPIIDSSLPVYLISSNEPITVEVSSSDDVNIFSVDNDQVSTSFLLISFGTNRIN